MSVAIHERGHGGLAVGLLDVISIVRSAGGLLLDHVGMTAQLARVEWQEEQVRLKRTLFAALVCLTLLGLALLHLLGLALVAAWDTPYRLHMAAAIALVYALAAAMAWRRLTRLADQTGEPFSGSIEELHKTLALVRSHL